MLGLPSSGLFHSGGGSTMPCVSMLASACMTLGPSRGAEAGQRMLRPSQCLRSMPACTCILVRVLSSNMCSLRHQDPLLCPASPCWQQAHVPPSGRYTTAELTTCQLQQYGKQHCLARTEACYLPQSGAYRQAPVCGKAASSGRESWRGHWCHMH